MDAADLEMFERSLRGATERHTGAELDAALAELGWADALSDDRHAAIATLFELQGSAGATSSAIDIVVRSALGLDSAAGVVLPASGSIEPPGSLDDATHSLVGLGTAALAGHETVAVVGRHGAGDEVVVVPVADLTLRTVGGIDPALGLIEVHGEVPAGPSSPVPDWEAVVAIAQVALGYELVGASRSMLAQAREHALDRIQFGQPIGRFQAVRHRLADTLIAIETAAAVLDGWWLDPTPTNAAIAKALAGRGARLAARHCQQVLAGIGFTTEHPLHLFVRRVLVLDELFGSARSLTHQLGDDLIASRQLPPLLPL
jgi:alkylation response protein AidB-like acyl-CoA dehydrogenase